jgi:anthraniloyl-CoA monooxygenase
LFNGLTLTFRENGAGVFAAHSYKFDKTTSTFIVECDEETWEQAGFADIDDDSTRNYLEQVFHLDLQGAELLSNNSKWLNFILVRNRNWFIAQDKTPHIVLLGDSLATVHFSIGSGTKLALEDSIALFHALRKKNPLQDALIEFESFRRPVVEEYQEAAYESLLFFENLKDYMHLDPLPFAYKLMTRSGKIDIENFAPPRSGFCWEV